MNFEGIIHWTVWITSIIFALSKLVKSSQNHYIIDPDDFDKGWTILNRMKDSSDVEWIMLTTFFKRHWWMFAILIIGPHFVPRFKTYPSFYYSLYSFLCISWIIGIHSSIIFLIYIFMTYAIHTQGQRAICYIWTVVSLLFLHNSHIEDLKSKHLKGETELFLFDVGFSWLIAKCLSFSIDRIDTQVHKQIGDVSNVIAYCLYLPTVFTGPIQSYDLFHKQMNQNKLSGNLTNLLSGNLLSLLYKLLWYFVYEFLLHFIYSSAVQYFPHTVVNYDSWSLFGLGYALPLMFYLKYYVIYGLPGCIAKLNGFHLPPPPKCISSVHLSSLLWRHFDRGLYLWIIKYLYHPFINKQWSLVRKMCGVVVSFTFVCVWHGMDRSIFLWCSMNCILVSSEFMVKFLCCTELGKQLNGVSALLGKRISAIAGTPHFILMCISCIFFLSNWDIGIIFVHRVFFSGFVPLIPLAFVMYCGCHVSMDCRTKTVSKEL